ncbi:MAG: hypothetical protein ACM3TR_11205 [Caulobacteraceae bacterium]
MAEGYATGLLAGNGFLLVLLLFIILAAGPVWGMDNRIFLLIALAIIGIGGSEKLFGYVHPEV